MKLIAWTFAICCLAAPGAETIVGWRGDGTGKFPDAQPPLNWSRVSPAVKALRCQALKPKGAEASGRAMADGVIREWLILGPLPAPDVPKAIEQDTLIGELEVSPTEGDKNGELVWKKIEAETATLDFQALLGNGDKSFACAHTYIFSEGGGDFIMQIAHRKGARFVFNGKAMFASGGTDGRRVVLKLLPGWNRLLLKVEYDGTQCFVTPALLAKNSKSYDEKNIAWSAPLPGVKTYFGTPASPGGPIVVGDKIFVTCEPHDLLCLDKRDGKILWARSNGYFDALTDDEKKADPAFKEFEPIAAKWNAINEAWVSGGKKAGEDERGKAEKEYYGGLQKIDKARFKRPEGQDVGYAGMTPASDGKFVYVWFASGVTACYDLEGNRKWIRIDNHQLVEHGFSSSPVLSGGKLVVFMRELMAFDAATGKEAWRNPIVKQGGMNPEGYFHGSLAHASVPGLDMVIPANGMIIDAADGKILFADKSNNTRQQVASPVIENGKAYFVATWQETLLMLPLPGKAGDTPPAKFEKDLKIPTAQFPVFYLGWHTASPLVHEGLIYLLNNTGLLTVVDEKTFTVVYQKMLDVDPFQNHNEGAARGVGISPTLGGKRLYLFGDSGACVVLEPGREFKQLAKNKIEGMAMQDTWGERQDRAVACPFIEGRRIYYRTESTLYALEEK